METLTINNTSTQY